MQKINFIHSSERVDGFELALQQQMIIDAPFISEVLNSVPDMMFILNEQRQIVAANSSLMRFLNTTNPSLFVGARPGEVVSCIHSNKGPDGCGTSEKCSACGAVLTILASQLSNKQVDGECSLILSLDGGTVLDLAVQATPIPIKESVFTIVALKDIGSEKRREVLERTFFHDVLNTTGGISGIANLLVENDGKNAETDSEFKKLMVDLSDNLIEEISQQRRLLSAERGEYFPEKNDIEITKLIEEVCKLYGNQVRTPGRNIVIEKTIKINITTDAPMLRRVLGNMILNASEATPVGGIVKISIFADENDLSISVINQGEILKDVQLSIFKRSFSTKNSSGRGIGTYSMKLFGEHYLGGKVDFRCQNGETIFFIQIPYAIITIENPPTIGVQN